MFEIIDIEQRTEAWHAFRQNHIGASEAPIIMGVSPFKSIHDLWLEKTNLSLKDQYPSPQMQRGIDLEAKALDCFNGYLESPFDPAVVKSFEYPWMIASLDGLLRWRGRTEILEIKCPNFTDHMIAISGKVPDKYYPQLQHQLAVTGLPFAYYFSFDGENGIYLKVERDEEYIKELIEKEREFWECVQNLVEPKDKYIHKEDDEWKEKAIRYAQLLGQKTAIDQELELAKDSLIQLAGDHPHCKGEGIYISKVLRKGAIDYGAVPELKNVNLEPYRKKSMEYWKIDID